MRKATTFYLFFSSQKFDQSKLHTKSLIIINLSKLSPLIFPIKGSIFHDELNDALL